MQKDGFLAAARGTKISQHFNPKPGAGLFGGEGFILQQRPGDGKAFGHTGGTIIEKRLNNELLRVGTGCVVAFEPGIDFSVARAGGLKSMIGGAKDCCWPRRAAPAGCGCNRCPSRSSSGLWRRVAAMPGKKAAAYPAVCWAAFWMNKQLS